MWPQEAWPPGVWGGLSALQGHGGDELLHLVAQPLLLGLLVQLQGSCDLEREESTDNA